VGHPAAAISGVDPVMASIRRRRRGEASNAAVRRWRPSVGDVDPQTRRPPGGGDLKKLDSSAATASTRRPEDAASTRQRRRSGAAVRRRRQSDCE
jgi:hypothetical protein